MRWEFIDPELESETRERAALIAAIDRWWEAFAAKAGELEDLFRGRSRWDLPAFMNEHLHAIHERLMWEFGPGVEGGHRLVITPEAEIHLHPLVKAVIGRAPKVEGWQFYPFRLPEPPETAGELVRARTGATLEGIKIRARMGPRNRIDLVFHSEVIDDADELRRLAFVAAESLLGEEVLNDWIGIISVADEAKDTWAGPERLRSTVETLIGTVREQLPRKPLHERDDDGWTMWRLDPDDKDDYPARTDLVVGKSLLPEMWMTAQEGSLFSSRRFSRCGETFCYVKIDGSAKTIIPEEFKERSELEQAVHSALREAGLGSHVGGGAGRRYSYLDLAVTDVGRAIPVLRETLRRSAVAPRSWLQFMDTVWGHEWVGVWDDAPMPPLP